MSVSNIDTCRLCNSFEIENVISLGEQIITSRFPQYGDYSTPKTPIDLCYCNSCGLLQLRQTTFSSELYEYEYGYRSGISNTMREHLKGYQSEILSKVDMRSGDTIVDIGSNDSTMLQYYSSQYRRIGVDPTGSQFHEYYGDVELLPNYFTKSNFQGAFGLTKCKIVSSISMFYDLPDPVQFAKGIYDILETDGIWTCEQSYVLNMLKTNSIDTICHEHLEYYALRQIKEIADRANFKIIDIKFNDCNGGSSRIYFAKRESGAHSECSELIAEILQNEIDFGLTKENGANVFVDFMKSCDKEVSKLRTFIDTVNQNGKKTYVYGASTKGNCLLQYANLTEADMKYAVERNPKKVGKMTNTGIEIISEETMRETPPDYLLVLPWHFRDEIVVRESAFLEAGGQLIFPFPHFEVVTAKSQKKCLITGCDGFIAHYVKDQFAKDYMMYGITRSTSSLDSRITKFTMDMKDTNQLEHIISAVQPDVIIHLASISSSHEAFAKPVDTLVTNGLLAAQICDIIHRNGWPIKLFNASSSEIYKGHQDYTITEDDTHKYHLHPYSIAKTMSHAIVDFYRTTYGLPFSNGVLFTTESARKKPVFLLNKVAAHVKSWVAGSRDPLILGRLDSTRNILHASDVASAIKTIVSQPTGDSYLVCNDESVLVSDLVLALYKRAGIILDTMWCDSEGRVVVQMDGGGRLSFDEKPIHMRGQPTKLRQLGWNPTFTVDQILDEIMQA